MMRWTQAAAGAARWTVPRHSDVRSTGRLGDWLNGVKARLVPTAYVDFADIPDEQPCPYRARLTLPKEVRESNADLDEREVVRGKARVLYEIRCACGRRWFSPKLEIAQICPRCDRAVLIEAERQPAGQFDGSSA
jgi:hypothetical protein